jgi:protein-S-isoprenylcysteine O-methyltransferase Ste14
MIAWINITVLTLASLLFLYYYVLSVSPAAMEMIIGPQSYAKCGHYRIVSGVFEFITVVCYVVYFFYPLPTPLPEKFPWSYWVSFIIAVIIGVPSIYLMVVGMKDAGEETAIPKKEHTMYMGIYERIRHPQATGEVFIWWVIAFLLNSPFLVLFSFIYIPIFLIMCWAEEHDLLIQYGEAYADYCREVGAFIPRRKQRSANT